MQQLIKQHRDATTYALTSEATAEHVTVGEQVQSIIDALLQQGWCWLEVADIIKSTVDTQLLMHFAAEGIKVRMGESENYQPQPQPQPQRLAYAANPYETPLGSQCPKCLEKTVNCICQHRRNTFNAKHTGM